MPLSNVQNLLTINPPFSPAFWRRMLGHLQDVRYIKLTSGNMPDLSVLSHTGLTALENEQHRVGVTGDQGQDRVLAPRLEDLVLECITFLSEGDADQEEPAITRNCLFDALSTRSAQGHLTMTECWMGDSDDCLDLALVWGDCNVRVVYERVHSSEEEDSIDLEDDESLPTSTRWLCLRPTSLVMRSNPNVVGGSIAIYIASESSAGLRLWSPIYTPLILNVNTPDVVAECNAYYDAAHWAFSRHYKAAGPGSDWIRSGWKIRVVSPLGSCQVQRVYHPSSVMYYARKVLGVKCPLQNTTKAPLCCCGGSPSMEIQVSSRENLYYPESLLRLFRLFSSLLAIAWPLGLVQRKVFVDFHALIARLSRPPLILWHFHYDSITQKFELRCIDKCPANHADKVMTPLLVLQGVEDKIVILE
ncbi:hypothetical protein EV363DRAFT_1523430 [Boletus edulis]|nr:hypothetical protein EV363DRAFT_1523430 [Boletus edulis]